MISYVDLPDAKDLEYRDKYRMSKDNLTNFWVDSSACYESKNYFLHIFNRPMQFMQITKMTLIKYLDNV